VFWWGKRGVRILVTHGFQPPQITRAPSCSESPPERAASPCNSAHDLQSIGGTLVQER
jgi:hypothetical protein